MLHWKLNPENTTGTKVLYSWVRPQFLTCNIKIRGTKQLYGKWDFIKPWPGCFSKDTSKETDNNLGRRNQLKHLNKQGVQRRNRKGRSCGSQGKKLQRRKWWVSRSELLLECDYFILTQGINRDKYLQVLPALVLVIFLDVTQAFHHSNITIPANWLQRWL